MIKLQRVLKTPPLRFCFAVAILPAGILSTLVAARTPIPQLNSFVVSFIHQYGMPYSDYD